MTALPDVSWADPAIDGVSDIAAIQVHEVIYGSVARVHVSASDGGVSMAAGIDEHLLAMPHGFIFEQTEYGPCLICRTALYSWPDRGNSVFIGDGYPAHGSCSYVPRPQGGVYASCESFPNGVSNALVPSLRQLDEQLGIANEVTGIRPRLVAADRLDRILESSDAGVRWIDAQGMPLSSWFSAHVDGALPLIGGGLLTVDDRVVPSGSSDVHPAPDWLRGRARGTFVVLSGRAYAFTDGSCTARVYSSDGELCGKVTFAGCGGPPRFGVDGTAMAPLCSDRQPLGLWMRLLR